MSLVYLLSVLPCVLYSVIVDPITPATFSHRPDRATLVNELNAPVIDSSWERDKSGHDSKVLVFAPVNFMGITSIARAHLTHDSLDHIEFYLQYRAHQGVNPIPPYGKMGFTQSTANDLLDLQNNLTNVYGEPSILATDFFEYFADGDRPYITGKYEDNMVILSVTPSPPNALLLKGHPQQAIHK